MAYVPPKDRVLEHSTSNSQTVFTVTGAIDTSFNAFSASMSIGDTTIGYIVEPGVAFKSGLLTYSATNEVTVTTATESKGTFSSSGTKEVAMGLPAARRTNPGLTDGEALGSATLMWSDLFLASGAVINFNNGNLTVTHSAGQIVLSGILGVTGNFAVNTNKFTVTASNGNTAVAGTLNVTDNTVLAGVASLTNSTNATSAASGAAIITGGLAVVKDIYCTGKLSIIPTSDPGLHAVKRPVATGVEVFEVQNSATNGITAQFFSGDSIAWNGNTANMRIGHESGVGRSINASGTINASGADYAEYETKRDDCGTIAKGQVVGFDVNGLLTDRWSLAVTFGIKSTDPSYIGGDVWGNEEALGLKEPREPLPPAEAKIRQMPEDLGDEETAAIEQENAAEMARYDRDCAEYETALAGYRADRATFAAALESARQRVDRIAYSGKVPVNATGAQPGDYIIAERDGDGIKGAVIADPTFKQYRCAVGRVRRVADDGRAIVAVIVH